MSRRFRSALALPFVAALLAGCGAGGFGGETGPEPRTVIRTYVALGDGFAAGPHLGTTTDASCLRSADNYPAQVARTLGVTTLVDNSCTGASTKSLTNRFKSPATKKELPAQLDAVTADTDLVTIGIGLEDQDLINEMFRICMQLPCGNAISPKSIVTQLDLFEKDLTSAVRSIQDEAPKSVIVLVGYPQIMPTVDACKKLPSISAAQLNASYIVLETVNKTIRSAAQQTGASYIDVAALSENHTACSDEPWVSGKDAKKGKVEPYHPLAAEQKAVADAVVAQVESR